MPIPLLMVDDREMCGFVVLTIIITRVKCYQGKILQKMGTSRDDEQCDCVVRRIPGHLVPYCECNTSSEGIDDRKKFGKLSEHICVIL